MFVYWEQSEDGELTSFVFTCAPSGVVLGQYRDKMVEIVDLVVPESPKSGDDVTLTCGFRLLGSNHRLYTVNWWRGKDQFYTFKGTDPDTKHAYTFPGIQVKVSVFPTKFSPIRQTQFAQRMIPNTETGDKPLARLIG